MKSHKFSQLKKLIDTKSNTLNNFVEISNLSGHFKIQFRIPFEDEPFFWKEGDFQQRLDDLIDAGIETANEYLAAMHDIKTKFNHPGVKDIITGK